MSIHDSLQQLEEEIREACARAGRSRDEVTLVAVSKTYPADAVREAFAAGQRWFGENRVKELVQKANELRDLPLHWHLIGSLQTNKVRAVLPHVELIHSVDRPELVRTMEAELAILPSNQAVPGILVQVNTTGEASKSGVAAAELPALVDRIRQEGHLLLRGLMTIGPLGGSPKEAQASFALLRGLRDRLRCAHPDLPMEILSMGMSGDFPLAVAEGATHLRIGSRIFGMRSTG